MEKSLVSLAGSERRRIWEKTSLEKKALLSHSTETSSFLQQLLSIIISETGIFIQSNYLDMSIPKQTSMSQVRQKSYYPNYRELEKSLSKMRSATKSVADDYSDRSHSKSPNYNSKRQQSSIASLKDQLHNIKSQVSRIMDRKSPQKSKSKMFDANKQKQFNDKSSFFKSDVESVDLDERQMERYKTSEYQSQNQDFNYFKIEYEILLEEYSGLKKRYVLQKGEHKDRVNSLNKKIRFLEKLIKEKEEEIFQYKHEIEHQLHYIRSQLVASKSNSMSNTTTNLENSSAYFSNDPNHASNMEASKLQADQLEKIKALMLDIERKQMLVKTTLDQYNEIKAISEQNSKTIHNLKITNGSLTKRLQEVQLTRHQFQEIKCYQQNLRKDDIFRIEQMQTEIKMRDQMIENMRGRIDGLGYQLNLVSGQNRELLIKQQNGGGDQESKRKTEQLQLQLDSMILVVNKLEGLNANLEREKMNLVEDIQQSRRRYEELKLQRQEKVEETVKNLVKVETRQVQIQVSMLEPAQPDLVIVNQPISRPKECQSLSLLKQSSSDDSPLYQCYVSKCQEISKHIKLSEAMRQQNTQFSQQVKSLRAKVHQLTQTYQKTFLNFSSMVQQLMKQNPSDTNKVLTVQLCNKIKDMSQQFVIAMQENEEIRLVESERREEIVRTKNKEIFKLESKVEEFQDVIKNQYKTILSYTEKIQMVQSISRQNQSIILEYLQTNLLENRGEVPVFLSKLSKISSSELFVHLDSEIQTISKLTKQNQLLYSDVVALTQQLNELLPPPNNLTPSQPLPEPISVN